MVRFLLGALLISLFLNGFLIVAVASMENGEGEALVSLADLSDRLALDSHGRERLEGLGQFVQIREARRREDQAQVEQSIMEAILAEHLQLDRVPERLDEWLDLEATYRYRVVEQFTRFSERLTPQQREDLADRLKAGGLFASLEQLR